MGGSQGNRASQGSWHGRDDRTETQHDEPIPGSPTRFNPRYRYRALCLVSLRWRLSDVLYILLGASVPSQRPNMSPLRLLLKMHLPVICCSRGFLPKGPASMVSLLPTTRHACCCCPVLSCPVPWMPQSSSTMGQAQLCQPGRRAGVPCVDHADTMHTDDGPHHPSDLGIELKCGIHDRLTKKTLFR